MKKVPTVSRRRIISAIGAVPLAPDAISSSPLESTPGDDPALVASHRWLDMFQREAAMARRWASEENRLIQHHAWFPLSEEDQLAAPEGDQLRQIDASLDMLSGQRAAYQKELRELASTSVEGAIAKLRVVALMIAPLDTDAHHVLCVAIEELATRLKLST